MKYYELQVNVRLREDLNYKDAIPRLSFILGKIMTLNDYLKTIHNENGIKLYTFSMLAPVTPKENYYEGEEYYFKIRSVKKRIITTFENVLEVHKENPLFYCLGTDLKVLQHEHINGLITLTPAVMIYPHTKHFWVKEDKLSDLIDAINQNIIRKYYLFTGIQIDRNHDFIESIKLTNINAHVKYKGGNIIGNKLSITVKNDKISQELAAMALGVGLLIKNSIGFGYCVKLK